MGSSLFDTNVLIDRMRAGITTIAGATTILNLIEFPKAVALKGLDIIIPGKDDYEKGFEMALRLLKAGTPIPTIDILLAAIAVNRRMVLHTKDAHFKHVQTIYQEFQVRIE